MTFAAIISFAIGLFLLYIFAKLLGFSIKIIMKLLINGLIGGAILLIFNLVGGIFGLSILINPLNAIIVGVLGVPGVILILILQAIL